MSRPTTVRESSHVLTDFRRHTSLQTRHELAVAFAAFEARHVLGVEPRDKDPQEYIAANRGGEQHPPE